MGFLHGVSSLLHVVLTEPSFVVYWVGNQLVTCCLDQTPFCFLPASYYIRQKKRLEEGKEDVEFFRSRR